MIALAKFSKEKIVYVDETGFNQYLHRECGRAKKGTIITGLISGKRFRRTSLVAGLVNRKQLIAPLQYEGTMDSKLFEHWFITCLLSELPEASVIVMDNARFHRKNELEAIIAGTGHQLLFLPPYSPDLNPIEKYWANLKKKMKKILHYFESFDEAFMSSF